MKKAAAEGVYLRMLEAVGARVGDIGPGIIAAHWPFVGSDYQGLVVVGQALQGWDAQENALGAGVFAASHVGLLAGDDEDPADLWPGEPVGEPVLQVAARRPAIDRQVWRVGQDHIDRAIREGGKEPVRRGSHDAHPIRSSGGAHAATRSVEVASRAWGRQIRPYSSVPVEGSRIAGLHVVPRPGIIRSERQDEVVGRIGLAWSAEGRHGGSKTANVGGWRPSDGVGALQG